MSNCNTSAIGVVTFARPITKDEFTILSNMIESAQSGETENLRRLVPSPDDFEWDEATDVQYLQWRSKSDDPCDWVQIAYAEQGDVNALAGVVQAFCIACGVEFALIPVQSYSSNDGGYNFTFFVTAQGSSECSGWLEARDRAITHLSRKRPMWAFLDRLEQCINRYKRQFRVNFEYSE
jgi:hypothetical protein